MTVPKIPTTPMSTKAVQAFDAARGKIPHPVVSNEMRQIQKVLDHAANYGGTYMANHVADAYTYAGTQRRPSRKYRLLVEMEITASSEADARRQAVSTSPNHALVLNNHRVVLMCEPIVDDGTKSET